MRGRIRDGSPWPMQSAS